MVYVSPARSLTQMFTILTESLILCHPPSSFNRCITTWYFAFAIQEATPAEILQQVPHFGSPAPLASITPFV